MKYARIIAEFYSRAWAIREETLLAMKEVLRLQSFEGIKFTQEEIRERINRSNADNGYVPISRGGPRFVAFDEELEMQAASGRRNAAKPGSVAVIPIVGIISHRMNLMSELSGSGGASVQMLTAQFRQALQDDNCKAIVFDVDSPGGSVEGVMELASEIFEGRGKKPITAVCNSMACSAAYWLASAANEVVCTPSGQCGSIGVYMVHQDESKALENDGIKVTLIKAGKYKAEGSPSEPLSEEARSAFQAKVDDYYGMFVKDVARNRGASQASVRDGYGQGRSVLAGDAVKMKLADRIATLDDVLGKYGIKPGAASQSMSGDSSSSANPSSLEHPRASKPGDDTEDDDGPCGCACNACKACKADDEMDDTSAAAKSRSEQDGDIDGDSSCTCPIPGGCSACKSCENRGAKGKGDHKYAAAAAGDWLHKMNSRRRQLDLARQ